MSGQNPERAHQISSSVVKAAGGSSTAVGPTNVITAAGGQGQVGQVYGAYPAGMSYPMDGIGEGLVERLEEISLLQGSEENKEGGQPEQDTDR